MHHQYKLPLINNKHQNTKNTREDLETARIYDKKQNYSQERGNHRDDNILPVSERSRSYSKNADKTDRNNIVIIDQFSQKLRQQTEDSKVKFKLQVSDVEQNNKLQLAGHIPLQSNQRDNKDIVNYKNSAKLNLKSNNEESEDGIIIKKLSLQTDQSLSTKRNLKGFRDIIGNKNNQLLTTFHFEHKWLKKLKSVFQAARAMVRIQLIVKPKGLLWNKAKSLEQGCKAELQFNTTVNAIKIKQWCQMVFTKAFSLIQSEAIDQQELNFIENKLSPFAMDNAVNVTFQIFWYFLTQFETFTNQKLFLRELGLVMFKEQFENQRKTFNKFVSSRTQYLSDTNKQITDDQRVMIYSESIIINLLQGLMLLTNNEKIVDLKKPNTLYLLRMIITLLQFLFMTTFKDLPKITQPNTHLKFYQYKLSQVNKQGLELLQCIQSEKEELIIGTYRLEQLNLILSKNYWVNSMKKCFRRILNNLFVYKF